VIFQGKGGSMRTNLVETLMLVFAILLMLILSSLAVSAVQLEKYPSNLISQYEVLDGYSRTRVKFTPSYTTPLPARIQPQIQHYKTTFVNDGEEIREVKEYYYDSPLDGRKYSGIPSGTIYNSPREKLLTKAIGTSSQYNCRTIQLFRTFDRRDDSRYDVDDLKGEQFVRICNLVEKSPHLEIPLPLSLQPTSTENRLRNLGFKQATTWNYR